ncbi:MAG: class I SAM-dependent methyltransferase, partial [bacterium]
MKSTSWSPVAKWYGDIVGESGHYFHEHIILPRLKLLLDPKPGQSVLDVGCGQGVYARTLTHDVNYVGIDLSRKLISQAKILDKNSKHAYYVADATHGLPVPTNSFTHAISILALQNMENGASAIGHIGTSLKQSGDFVMVINHP